MGKKRKHIEVSTPRQLRNYSSIEDDQQQSLELSKLSSNSAAAAERQPDAQTSSKLPYRFSLGSTAIHKSNTSANRALSSPNRSHVRFEQWSPLAKKVCSRSSFGNKQTVALKKTDGSTNQRQSTTAFTNRLKDKLRNVVANWPTLETKPVISREPEQHSERSIIAKEAANNNNAVNIECHCQNVVNCDDISHTGSKCIKNMTASEANCLDHDVSGDILALKPLFFELPATGNEVGLIGREWVFAEIESALNIEQGRGIMVCGRQGSGKSSIVLQLVENSCFGRRNLGFHLNPWSTTCYSISNHLSSLGAHLVAYHFCQVESNKTCLVPEFVHSIAAQLCQVARLRPYRTYLTEHMNVLVLLSLDQCRENPSKALLSGILEPLKILQRSNELSIDECLIVVDSLCEAEYHRCDSGDTISTFLAKHILRFPSWLKLILTVRTNYQSIISLIPFHKIRLDGMGDEMLVDLNEYIKHRTNESGLLKEAFLNETWLKKSLSTLDTAAYLSKLAEGNFLFLKLILDLIEEGSFDTSSKSTPKRLSQLFLLICNLRFPTIDSYEKVKPILSTCLASLNPMTLLEIYHSVNSLQAVNNIAWEEFVETFKSLNGLLIERSDGTYMLFHSTFREWLLRRENDEPKDFICDSRIGHAAIAFRLSRIEVPLNTIKTLELAHHVLKGHIYRKISCNNKGVNTARELQAIWMSSSSSDLSAALGCHANIFYPNIKVARLLLIAGASPNQTTNCNGKAPIVVCASAEGLVELVSLLLDFGANINSVNVNGENALHLAIVKGRLDMVHFLLENNINVALKDNFGNTALGFATTAGDEQTVKLLLDHGACLEDSANLEGDKPLAIAIKCGHLNLVKTFLKKGARLCPNTWVLAGQESNKIIEIILQKVFQDGFMLSKKGLFNEAIHRYEYALRRIPDMDNYELNEQKIFSQLKFMLTRELGHCRSEKYAIGMCAN